jgi:hypothetical protein
MPCGIRKGKNEVTDPKTKPAARALLRAVAGGELDNLVDPLAAQLFEAPERRLVTLFRIERCGEDERVFDRHGGALPGMWAYSRMRPKPLMMRSGNSMISTAPTGAA